MAITEIVKNKKYKIQVYNGYTYNNGIKHYKRINEYFCGKKSDAEIRENEIKNQLKKGNYIDNKALTYNDLIDEWYKQKTPKLDIKTINSYNGLLIDIRKELGNYKATDLKAIIFEKFYNKLRASERHLTENTILHYYTLNNTILNQCVKWELIEKNYNALVERPKPLLKEAKYYDDSEIDLLLKSLNNEPLKYRTLILLALDSGCRRGELTGLNWNDIYFNTSQISITKTTQYLNRKIIEKDNPKNSSSRRTITISQLTLLLLKLFKEEQDKQKQLLGDKWENTNKVFTNKTGGLMHPDTPSKIFKKIQKKYGLKNLNFHGLRHTSASMLISSNVNMKIISDRLGHASSITTDRTYSHIFKNAEIEASNKMAQKYFKAPN